MTLGSSLTQAVRSNVDTVLLGTLSGLDVEVVEHLEMVGDEPDGGHDDAVDGSRRAAASSSMTSRMSGPSHGSGVRPALCQAICQSTPSTRSSRPATASAVERSSSGYGSPVVEDPLGERVRREQHPRPVGHGFESLARDRRRGSRRTPARSPTTRRRGPRCREWQPPPGRVRGTGRSNTPSSAGPARRRRCVGNRWRRDRRRRPRPSGRRA